MSRLLIRTPSQAQAVVDNLYGNMERRIAASPPGLCPVDMALNFLNLCHAQSCGKCTPCRIGLGQLSTLLRQVLDGEATMDTLDVIRNTAKAIVDSTDCAIGTNAAQLVLDGLEGFRDDYISHIQEKHCLGSLQNPVPCVALRPAGVDIPGYIALVAAGRLQDAVKLIRKDNPWPIACAYICEHPCEARCRRTMMDNPMNIRGLKKYAVNNAGFVPNPPCAPKTGKKVAVIGGGNVAMDVCRSSVRLGAEKVSCVYRRRQSDMTALPEEVEGALAEGVEMLTLQAPVRIEADENGNAVALWTQPQVIGPMDKAYRPRPMKADAPENRIEADLIVLAIGQGVETHGFEQMGIQVKRGSIAAEADSRIPAGEGIFAGGDCVTGPATAIRAIAAGKVAAANIDEYLGFHNEITTDVEVPTPRFNNKPPHGRVNLLEREASERKHDFNCIECEMSAQEAQIESTRCLRCDYFGYGNFKGGRNEKW